MDTPIQRRRSIPTELKLRLRYRRRRSNKEFDVWSINRRDITNLAPSQRKQITDSCHRVVIAAGRLLLYVKRTY